VSRSDDGALIPHVSAFELPELLGEICSEMGRRIEDKGQQLELALGPGVGVMRGDRDLVRRIVENLIDNAYKYGPKKATISVEVLRATMDAGAEPAVEIRVRDEGAGIPETYRQVVFEKYGRAGGSGAPATAWGWCSAAGRRRCTAAPSGSMTRPPAAAASAFAFRWRACR